jgi:hypothetical protein
MKYVGKPGRLGAPPANERLLSLPIRWLFATVLHSVITFADEARPALFWKVYLAFDEGEYRHENDEPEGDPVQTYTHPMVAEVVSEYADIRIK